MGLDCSHDAWHGSYGSFHEFRKAIAEAAGLPPLELMEGFYIPLNETQSALISPPTLYHGMETNKPVGKLKPYFYYLDKKLPIKWSCLKPSFLHEFLWHSDCEGEMPSAKCGAIADEMEKLVDKIDLHFKKKLEMFIDGLRLAAKNNEDLLFR